MRTDIKRIDMLKILLLAKFKDSKFCYIIILRVAKQLIQLNNNYRYSDNSGSDTWWKSNILAKSAEGLRNESGASKGSQYCCGRIINYEGVQRELPGSRKGGREDSII